MAALRHASRDLALDLRQAVAISTQQKNGRMYQAWNAWLRMSGFPVVAGLVGRRNLVVVHEMLVAYLQFIYEENRPHSHGPVTLVTAQYFHRSL